MVESTRDGCGWWVWLSDDELTVVVDALRRFGAVDGDGGMRTEDTRWLIAQVQILRARMEDAQEDGPHTDN